MSKNRNRSYSLQEASAGSPNAAGHPLPPPGDRHPLAMAVDGSSGAGPAYDEILDPPARIFDRLRQIAGYTWDESRRPLHSSYDSWHVFGTRFVSSFSASSSSHNHSAQAFNLSPGPRLSSCRPSPSGPAVLFSPQPSDLISERTSNSTPDSGSASGPTPSASPLLEEAVVARVSFHVLREERTFHIAQNMISSSDPHGDHIAKPVDLLRLSPLSSDRGPLIVAIYMFPGVSQMSQLMDLGPAYYYARPVGDSWEADIRDDYKIGPPISLEDFLDFSIGATQCLELIHHHQNIVHGEIRADAFHFNRDNHKVKVISFGSGLRSFENGLTSTGWSTLSKELGARNKLLYISPEQTGRMPAEPDTRTDIYSLGVLFWMLLTQQPVFDGETPLDIVQGVLGRRIPNVSAIRLDVPDAIGRIVQKCTAKAIGERYHSASGLRHDLVTVQKFLANGELDALKDWQVGSRDVSSFFMLPIAMVGREAQQRQLLHVIGRVAKIHAMNQSGNANRFSDGSSFSNEAGDAADGSSEGGASSSEDRTNRSGSITHMAASSDVKLRSSFQPSLQSSDGHTISGETASSSYSMPPHLRFPPRSWDRHQSVSYDIRSPLDGIVADREGGIRQSGSFITDSSSSLSRQLGPAKFRRRGHCEIITVEGTAGLGKSCLVQSVMSEARRRGYCATAKFDKAKKSPFGPLLHLLSSLFHQVWGERNTDTPFHVSLRQYVWPIWPMLHQLLGLPEFLFVSADGRDATAGSGIGGGSGGSGVNGGGAGTGSGLVRSPPPNVAASTFPAKKPRTAELKRRDTSPATSTSSLTGPAKDGDAGSDGGSGGKSSSRSGSSAASSLRLSASSSQDYLRAGSSTKTNRLMNTYLDILFMFTSHKFICFCLDDLHFADAESLDLITQIISARMRMVIIVTFRPEDMSPERVLSVLNPPEPERATSDYTKAGKAVVTRVQLGPLEERDIVKYVSATLCRPEHNIMQLAIVINAKTAGNPFYIREMLKACYAKKCIWYDYHDSQWCFDINRVFEEFRGDNDCDILQTDFITSRLQELPPASRAILGWAALLGNAFSFDLICHLLSGEFNFIDETCPGPLNTHTHTAFSQQDAVVGLQATLQACIIASSDTDDLFRFAHDRYIQASTDLRMCNTRKMHYVITQTLLKYYGDDPRARENAAPHVCECIDIIKSRIHRRRPYRKLLFDCAHTATQNGARPTAAKYYSNAVALLQTDPWTDDGDDASYNETIQLYLRAAECYLYMSQHPLANGVLATIFRCARTPFDKAPAWVLQSRIYKQSGNISKALKSLQDCLHAMDVEVEESPTYEGCDREFMRLMAQIQSMDHNAVLNPPSTNDLVMASVGAVLAEAVSTSWWTDSLYFYHLSVVMVHLHLTSGPFPHSGIGFLYLAMVALSRFNMVRYAADLGNYALELLDRLRDPFSMARGYMLFAGFVGHIQYPLSHMVAQLEGSMEYGASAGDRMSAIVSFGLAAMMKFFASENVVDLEGFCEFSCEEIPNWHQDTQGGTLLIAARQACRALQGKTTTSDPLGVMSDDQHNVAAYKEWLQSYTLSNGDRPLLYYETIEIMPLYLYGHYDEVVDLGKRCLSKGSLLLSARNVPFAMLFTGLAHAGIMLRRQQDPRRPREGAGLVDEQRKLEDTILKLQELSNGIRQWADVSDVNYFAWSSLLDAQISELSGDIGRAIRQYEEALDHASEQDFVFDEALGNYLMAGVFIRKAARRSARGALLDAIGLYRQLGAVGVADRIEEEHSLLLRGPTRNPRTIDAAVQTEFAAGPGSVQYHDTKDPDDEQAARNRDDILLAGSTQDQASGPEHLHDIQKGVQIGVWRGTMQAETEAGAVGLPALDMIDLHAILQSSQIISSVLRVDELLKTMCDVILQTCGGSATHAAIVVQDEGGSDWCVAASGDPEKGAVAHLPGIPLTGTPIVAENIVLYSMRLREAVFVSDLMSDERFGNVSQRWLQKTPQSKSIIVMPICHASNPLLGVLYLEGMPGAFTDRNVTVLRLLVNQIGISYSNALAIKAIEKVSAENRSMVAMQKRALQKAIQAENKAKEAEKEAKRNVKLAEEATKAKSIFLANVSHELRTPLNGVIGNSELLRDSDLTTEQRDMAEAIRLSADLLLIVINDILDFSRMEADKMKLYIVAFNPKELIPEVIRAASYRNQEKTKLSTVDVIQLIDLPADLFVCGDPVRLHQVLGNLIGNSIKFTEDGTVTVGARVESEAANSVTLTFWVEDTGIGIPPMQMEKLFQPFSQADTSTARKYGGSGLGLSICKSLVETMMKGKIFLESTENVGTKVWFTVSFDKAKNGHMSGEAPPVLPASSPQTRAANATGSSTSALSSPINTARLPVLSSSAAVASHMAHMGSRLTSMVSTISSTSSSSSSHRHLGKEHRVTAVEEGGTFSNAHADLTQVVHDQLRICIAEDNAINRKIAIQYLVRLGYETVDAYDNGLKAVEALRQKAQEGKPYHVILMDVQMPVLDGYEATKLLRKDANKDVREVLVIAMTASAIQGDREKCLSAGMNDYLAKPVKVDVLRRKLAAYTGVEVPDQSRPTGDDGHPTSPGGSGSEIGFGSVPISPTAVVNGFAVIDPATDHATDPSTEPAMDSAPVIKVAAASSNGSFFRAVSSSRSRSASDAGQLSVPPQQRVQRQDGEARDDDGDQAVFPCLSEATPAKRQPRKLTKARGTSDLPARPQPTVLQKKSLHQQQQQQQDQQQQQQQAGNGFSSSGQFEGAPLMKEGGEDNNESGGSMAPASLRPRERSLSVSRASIMSSLNRESHDSREAMQERDREGAASQDLLLTASAAFATVATTIAAASSKQ